RGRAHSAQTLHPVNVPYKKPLHTPNVWLSGSGGDCTTTTANPLLTLHFAPAFASGEAAVRCNRGWADFYGNQ
ncbi:MAG: hypothetical protein D6694_15495, partial [Gammaproteobacteria bacterium]